jgi:Bacterial Ig-like domain (group 2)
MDNVRVLDTFCQMFVRRVLYIRDVKFRAFIFLLVCGIAVASCSGGSAPISGSDAPSVSIPGGGSTLSLAAGASSTVSVSQSNYTGTFAASSSNVAVATVSPGSAQGTFIITGVATGSATISFTDQSGDAVKVPVTVSAPARTTSPSPAPADAVQLSPSTLNFSASGAQYAQTVSASQNDTGTFTVFTTTCNGIAAISPISGKAFTVTPVAAGSCTFTIMGGAGQTATLTVGVTTTTVGGQ